MTTLCSNCLKNHSENIESVESIIDIQKIFDGLEEGFVESGFMCEKCGLIAIGNIKGELKVIRIKSGETSSWEKVYLE